MRHSNWKLPIKSFHVFRNKYKYPKLINSRKRLLDTNEIHYSSMQFEYMDMPTIIYEVKTSLAGVAGKNLWVGVIMTLLQAH